RILAQNVQEHFLLNIWLDCPGCSWLNGMDIDLAWAKYVVSELQERKLSLERVEELLTELREWRGSVDGFIARNPDISNGPMFWLAKISLGTLIAILALLYSIYSTHQSDEIARQSLRVEQEQLHAAGRQPEAVLTPAEIQQLATELHRLQEEVRIKPPPSPPRRRG
ncbi:MAG TPA: hypothetical protein VFH80_07070, partial [Solirubrobacteraceae bacterium]|nr:hypothetical protein [Solirubrobacteraceae bacterium]